MASDVCRIAGCRTNADASLGGEHFCLEHFICSCFQRLDECQQWLDAPVSRREDPDALQQLLADYARRAEDLFRRGVNLSNLERARLAYIQVVADELSRRLRRSPRRLAAICLRIRSEEPGPAWAEETQTKTISRRGALIECVQPLSVGDKLFVTRIDTGQQTRAQVAWHRSLPEQHLEVGIEFLDCENFWGLDWKTEAKE